MILEITENARQQNAWIVWKIVFLFYVEEAKNGLKKTKIVIVFYRG